MTLISKTVYPRFNTPISQSELAKFYTPSHEELEFAKTEVKGDINLCVFLICLKTYQNLRYFPNENEIPKEILKHLKEFSRVRKKDMIEFKERSTRRYRNSIRNYFNVNSDKDYIKALIIEAIEEYEPIMENSADIFNAVVEVLLKNNCELPSFRALNRTINEKRFEVENNIFKYISSNLNDSDKTTLDKMLEVGDGTFSRLNYIKELPKSPTLKHIKEVRDNYLYLRDINIGKGIINTISPSKINNFASQIGVLDAS